MKKTQQNYKMSDQERESFIKLAKSKKHFLRNMSKVEAQNEAANKKYEFAEPEEDSNPLNQLKCPHDLDEDYEVIDKMETEDDSDQSEDEDRLASPAPLYVGVTVQVPWEERNELIHWLTGNGLRVIDDYPLFRSAVEPGRYPSPPRKQSAMKSPEMPPIKINPITPSKKRDLSPPITCPPKRRRGVLHIPLKRGKGTIEVPLQDIDIDYQEFEEGDSQVKVQLIRNATANTKWAAGSFRWLMGDASLVFYD